MYYGTAIMAERYPVNRNGFIRQEMLDMVEPDDTHYDEKHDSSWLSIKGILC